MKVFCAADELFYDDCIPVKTTLFDFTLPDSLIATHPASPRDSAKMLVIGNSVEDKSISDFPSFLRAGDVLVFNDTRVIPARLFGKRGLASIEFLLHKKSSGMRWSAFAKPAKRLRPGDEVVFADDFKASVVEKLKSGEVLLEFGGDVTGLYANLERYGHMPLPPYIERQRSALSEDKENAADQHCYQTVYARHEGSVAAPTAGLHFTEDLLQKIEQIGVKRAYVTLHVGGGTFLPVKTEDTKDHVMHSEYAIVTPETANIVNAVKAAGGRVVCVGTTSLRTLESASDENGCLHPFQGETAIFITPGYRFKIVNILLTNFHLPRSTLFMLVSAFSGLERMKSAYNYAISMKYRFYSYGDACLLFCNH